MVQLSQRGADEISNKLLSIYCCNDIKVCVIILATEPIIHLKVYINQNTIFSYTMDVLVPEVVIRLLMDIHHIEYREVSITFL